MTIESLFHIFFFFGEINNDVVYTACVYGCVLLHFCVDVIADDTANVQCIKYL